MTRLVRTTKVGVKVSKPVYGFAKFRALLPQETMEPAIIDTVAHAQFVNNLLSIRSKTQSVLKERPARVRPKAAALVD